MYAQVSLYAGSLCQVILSCFISDMQTAVYVSMGKWLKYPSKTRKWNVGYQEVNEKKNALN